jgi:hypothetical protein
MVLFRKRQFLTPWTIITVSIILGGCSTELDQLAQGPSPDIHKAIPAIKAVASQYHLIGQLQIAGPIIAPAISVNPWVICLRSTSETRFTIAIFYKADTIVSSREATLGDSCDSQEYKPIPN